MVYYKEVFHTRRLHRRESQGSDKMINIILSGCNGRMGQVITNLALEDPGLCIAAGVDITGERKNTYPVFKCFEELAQADVRADVIIDFSAPAAFDDMLAFSGAHKVPAVVCTTGLSEAQIASLNEASAGVALLRSANMSLGINLLISLLKQAAPVLDAAGFDIEIVEKHHNQKKDAPSGTAIALAEAVNDSLNGSKEFIYDRSQRYEKRDPKEIGISAVRGGTIVGDHDVIFAGTDEVITLSHRAYSRAVFAKGALQAAKYLAGKAPGLYTMADVIAG